MKIHYITYANGISRVTGKPYKESQKKLIDSIQSKTKYEIIFHTHDLETIKTKKWFNQINSFKKYEEIIKRDGMFCLHKPFLTKDVLEICDENDLVYYTDSSAYYSDPFLYNLDKLNDYVFNNGSVYGSIGTDTKNDSFGCCDKIIVWNEIWENYSKYSVLNKPHLLNSWFLLKNDFQTKKIINEWLHFCTKEVGNKILASYHHTVEQSILNVIAYKYNLKVFFNNQIHDHNKNHNAVHYQLSLEKDEKIENVSKWFINIRE